MIDHPLRAVSFRAARSASSSLGRLRDVLAQAGYDGVEQTVTDHGELTLAEGLATLRLRPDADERLLVLARLFLAGETVAQEQAASALRPVSLAELPGLVSGDGGGVRALARIEPFEGMLVASDASYRGDDTVLGIGAATRMLRAVTIRRHSTAALDLCTGSGAVALANAEQAEVVVGTDLNARALELASVNAALNRLDSVEWRLGDLFEPVEGERFDLITANPPFVVSPVQEFLFRDGGSDDDGLSQTVVTGAAARLTEGGFAHVICNWVVADENRWSERPREWLRGSGCDALLLRYRSETPRAYAFRWCLTPGRTPAEAAEAAAPWLEYYRRRGIEHLVTGVIVIRRRGGVNWIHEDELVRPPGVRAGEHVGRLFAGQDVLASLPDERALLNLRLSPTPGVRLVERRQASGELERARLGSDDGLGLLARLPLSCVPVVARLDGTRTVLAALEAAVPEAAGGAADKLFDDCVPTIAELLGRGWLESLSPST